MIHRQLAFLVTTGFLAVATARSRLPDNVPKQTESTTEKSVGTVKMTNETKQVGATLEVKSEAKADTPAGTVALKTETIEGTVTVFTAGRMIEVMTGEKKMHRFSLDDKDAAYSVDGTVAVGKRLTVTDEIGADKVRRISVRSRA